MVLLRAAALVGLLASGASAALAITNPVADSVFHGTSAAKSWTFRVAWEESDNSTSPLTSAFGESTLQLMVGSTYEQYVVANLTTLDPSAKSSFQASVASAAAGNSSDYFIRIRSRADGALESFSHKFALASMTGSFSPEESSAIAAGLATSSAASSAASSSSIHLKSSSSSKAKAKAVATSVSSASSTSGSATASKANKAAETTLPAASGAQRVALSAGAVAAVAAGVLALFT